MVYWYNDIVFIVKGKNRFLHKLVKKFAVLIIQELFS